MIIIRPILIVVAFLRAVSAADVNVETIPTEPTTEDITVPVDIVVGDSSAVMLTDGEFNNDDPNHRPPLPNGIPSSLVKATLVGAQLRQENDGTEDTETSTYSNDNDPVQNNNINEEASHTSKPPLAGCVWGSTGCNKGKWHAASDSTINSSSSEDATNHDDDDVVSNPSSFAGSATAKIKARVKEARGKSSRRTASSTIHENHHVNAADDETHQPPQGFQLSARVVTSSSDGLSYFLDASDADSNLDGNRWMTVPYTYVECGPTVESTTEAFPLGDMVVRHFPAGAAMGHWVNLAGGVTLENSQETTTEGDEEFRKDVYMGDYRDGHPKLLVALTPIEITVSGNDEETRTFYPGEVVLMEDTMGKGHKMRAARDDPRDPDSRHSVSHGQDLSVLMISLPHTVHYSSSDTSSSDRTDGPSSSSPPAARHSVFGFASRRSKHPGGPPFTVDTKPCPLEYDPAYSSLYPPSHPPPGQTRRRRKKWNRGSVHSPTHADLPLPSLRQTLLFGIGLSLTSSFALCLQLLYPPLLVLLGGATVVMGGALVNVVSTRWLYARWVWGWEEKWRWRREIESSKRRRKEEEEGVMDGVDDGGLEEDDSLDGKSSNSSTVLA